MNEIIEKRRSIRKFCQDKPVSKEQLNQMLNAAMLSPSACNSRPWEFIVITKRETLDEIAAKLPNAGMCETASAAIVIVAIPQSGKPEGYFPQDCGAATQNILLEAFSMGIGTCWCGIYPKEDRIVTLRQLLSIPEPKLPFNVIAVGIPNEEPEQRGFFEKEKVSYIE